MTYLFVGFIALVLVLLALDLGVLNRKAHVIGLREAVAWSVGWITLGLSFAVVVYFVYEQHWFGARLAPREGSLVTGGSQAAVEYLTAYLVEKSLSVDNVFVIALVFSSFRVAQEHQHRVLFWGILGALVMRAAMIGGGLMLVSAFEEVLYLFGGYLAFAGLSLLRGGDDEHDPQGGRVVRWARRLLRIAPGESGGRFTTVLEGRRRFTSLALVLLVVEWTDVVFAVDSIPAVLAVSDAPFILFTSNIFAILGLRSLYFVLADAMERFAKLKYALALILLFIGLKMLLHDLVHVPNLASLAVVGLLLSGGIAWSLRATRGGVGGAGPPLGPASPSPDGPPLEDTRV